MLRHTPDNAERVLVGTKLLSAAYDKAQHLIQLANAEQSQLHSSAPRRPIWPRKSKMGK